MVNAVRPVIVSNGVPYVQITSVVSHSTSGRNSEKQKERKDRMRKAKGFGKGKGKEMKIRM